jgi:SOS regulatory protein LexA
VDLNAEQKRIAFQEPRGHSLLRGVAGSGKTSVAIFRVPFLLNNYCFASDDAILLATYNRTLITYMEYLYEKMSSRELGEYRSLFATPERRVDIKTVDSLMFSYFRDYLMQTDQRLDLDVKKAVEYDILSEGVAKLKKQFPSVAVLKQKNTVFLLDEINWIKDCLYLEEEEYQNADRVGKAKGQSDSQPQRLLKNSETRKAIFELMRFYDKMLRDRGCICWADMRLIALEQVRKKPRQRYTHLLIDESQDLTRAQLLFLKEILNQKDYSSILFVSDTAQCIYPRAWLGSGRSFTSIGLNMAGRSSSLSKNFRTTTQISQAAYSLIEDCPEIVEDEYFVKPSLIDKQGEFPVLKKFSDNSGQLAFLAEEIADWAVTRKLADIAVIARFKNQIESVKNFLEKKGLRCEYFSDRETSFDSESVKLVTMHSIKGLEFPVVFIVGLDGRVLPYYTSGDPDSRAEDEIKERRLLYVGMTRATEFLYLLANEPSSKFLGDIDHRCTKLNRQAKLRSFYNVPLEKYRFRDKIPDLHTGEEKIRQWLLAELINTYNYPLQSLKIEYPVKSFSKKGYVDVAAEIVLEGNLTPFMFIETKAPGHRLKDGLDQVKSYMSASEPCAYGAMTDGTELVVIDRKFKTISDIPPFKEHWLSSAMRQYRYRNLKSGIEYTITGDENDPTNIELSQPECAIFVEQKDIVSLPVYGEIAAGQPICMNPELEESFPLPAEWYRGGEYFILKVRGDSMQNAGIDQDDYVVLRSQNTAVNLDIVVAGLNDNALLKRFSRMGNNVLLLSENPKYDPIMVDQEQAVIMGVAVGVLKNARVS